MDDQQTKQLNNAVSQLRILHVLEATGGGTKRHVLDLIRGTSSEAFSHLVACPRRRHPFYTDDTIIPELEQAHIPYYPVEMPRSIHPVLDLYAILRVVNLLWRERVDLVHAHSSKGGMVGRVAARLAGKPIIYTPHGLYFQGQTGRRRSFYLAVEKMARPWADCVIAVSESEGSVIIKEGIASPARTVLIENGIDPNAYHPVDNPKIYRRRLQLPEHAAVVGTLSRFAPQKDPEVLFQTAKQLIAEVPDLHFVWCGVGELQREYIARCQVEQLGTRLHFLGFCPEVVPVLSSLDVFLVASRFEGLPYSVLEAMALGVPVVATDVVGLCDLVVPNETGLQVAPGKPQALVDAVRALLGDPVRSRTWGQAGRLLVERRFTLERMLRLTEATYLNVALGQEHQLA